MKLRDNHLRTVSFPVGGIGAGCVGLAGNGRLVDWEIFNHPAKGSRNGWSHFTVRALREGRVVDARILNGDLPDHWSGEGTRLFSGFGFGAHQETMCGFLHFRECSFEGAFPVAEVTLRDPDFPGAARVRAWSPFVPGESDLASLPCAVFEIDIENTTPEPLQYDCGAVLCNPWDGPGAANAVERDGALTRLVCRSGLPNDDIRHGEIAVTTDSPETLVQPYFFRGGWMDRFEVYWHDWTSAAPQPRREYPPRAQGDAFPPDTGLLAGRLDLAPGARGRVRFVLSWFVPNRENDFWKDDPAFRETLAREGLVNRWRNYYATLCSDAADAASQLFARFDSVKRDVLLFRDALHAGTLPAAALQGAAANLAVLVSPTCLRLEDGTFWGWEGVSTDVGSCHGTCQHVWNYAQALPLLFPDLERTIRESQARFNFDERGGWHFRLGLPLGTSYGLDWSRPCVDGSFGEVMKIFREWKISGDDDWLRRVWPAARRAVEWAWSPDNPDRWDPGRTGLVTGRQHNTLDIELFGPSAWLNGHYLGALRAASLMAPVCGDEAFGRECAEIFRRGRALTEERLFNGEYYVQRIDLADASIPASFEGAEGYWDAEHGQIKYQMGEGCASDALLAQWYASLYGLGDLFDPARVHAALAATFRHNFLPSMRRHNNTWRVFMKDDEAGLVVCFWPEGADRPVIPVPYNTESLAGIEWAFASHLVMNGFVDEGARLAAAIRARYDGAKRNPWNEIECGSNYARSMASYAMLQAWSGFTYDMTEGRIGFHPALPGDFRSFWSLGTVWGEFERRGGTSEIRILHGGATLHSLAVDGDTLRLNGGVLPATRDGDALRLTSPCAVRAGDVLAVG